MRLDGDNFLLQTDPSLVPLKDALNCQVSILHDFKNTRPADHSDRKIHRQITHRRISANIQPTGKPKSALEISHVLPLAQGAPLHPDSSQNNHIPTNQKLPHHRWPFVRTVLGTGRIDPFRSYPIEADRYEHQLADHYASICCQAFPTEKETGYSRLLTKWIPLCMTNEMAFKSLLFGAEIHSRGITGGFAWSPRAIRLSMESCALLRKEIEKPNPVISDAMIATVINLSVVELSYGGQRSKYDNHMSGLEQMIRLRGGVENLESNGYMKGMVIWANQIGGRYPKLHAHTADGETDKGIDIQTKDVPSTLPTPSDSSTASISPELVGNRKPGVSFHSSFHLQAPGSMCTQLIYKSYQP
ncbi:hypothetical protein N431DRAFT_102171 [Stipitochalara longipes BDJ]|nr:hypothetical protein N431DRAFT_102171 [Stipitochalara longipes BDJ]